MAEAITWSWVRMSTRRRLRGELDVAKKGVGGSAAIVTAAADTELRQRRVGATAASGGVSTGTPDTALGARPRGGMASGFPLWAVILVGLIMFLLGRVSSQ